MLCRQPLLHIRCNRLRALTHIFVGAVKSGVFTNKVLDIEDMVTAGKQCNACPYYAAREISKQASCAIVFTPYNYLLDKRWRSSQNLEVGGNILIVDEAHNLVSFYFIVQNIFQ